MMMESQLGNTTSESNAEGTLANVYPQPASRLLAGRHL